MPINWNPGFNPLATGTLSKKLNWYVPPRRVWFWNRCGQKMGTITILVVLPGGEKQRMATNKKKSFEPFFHTCKPKTRMLFSLGRNEPLFSYKHNSQQFNFSHFAVCRRKVFIESLWALEKALLKENWRRLREALLKSWMLKALRISIISWTTSRVKHAVRFYVTVKTFKWKLPFPIVFIFTAEPKINVAAEFWMHLPNLCFSMSV